MRGPRRARAPNCSTARSRSGFAAWIAADPAAGAGAQVVLGGGCMMNRVLAEDCRACISVRGTEASLARAAPANDGGLSLGQATFARAVLSQKGA